jgi:hypothetical protein
MKVNSFDLSRFFALSPLAFEMASQMAQTSPKCNAMCGGSTRTIAAERTGYLLKSAEYTGNDIFREIWSSMVALFAERL